MQFGQPRPTARLISLTPLIDVVFILLVFFMLASSFLDWRSVDLTVSSGVSAAPATDRAILVSLQADGSLRIGAAPVAKQNVRAVLAEKFAGDLTKRMVIRSEAGVPLQSAVDILDIARAMGAKNVSLSRKR